MLSDEFSSKICDDCINDLINAELLRDMLIECNTKVVMIKEEMKMESGNFVETTGASYEVSIKEEKVPSETGNHRKSFAKPSPKKTDEIIKPQNKKETCKYSCHRCQKIVNNLGHHMKVDHPYEPLEFKCHYCNKIYEKISTLQTHYYSHHRPHPKIVCGSCGKRFTRNCLLKEHIQSDHFGIKKFVCDICHTRFKTKYSLKLHLRRHTMEKPHKCQFCDKVRPNFN